MTPLPQPALISDSLLLRWMNSVLQEARAGVARGENPFGAGVFNPDGSPVAIACNQANSTGDPSAHAEVCAISLACKTLGTESLENCWLLATAEPCPMCLSTAVIAGIRHIAFGATQAVVTEAGFGSLGITGRELADQFSEDIEMRGSIRGNECVQLLLRNRA